MRVGKGQLSPVTECYGPAHCARLRSLTLTRLKGRIVAAPKGHFCAPARLLVCDTLAFGGSNQPMVGLVESH